MLRFAPMGYELCLRRRTDGPELAAEPLAAELRAAGAVGAEGALTFTAGGAQVPVKLAWNDGRLLGADLDVPFGAPESDFRAAVLLAAGLAAKLGTSVEDPQLGGELTPDRAEAAVESWRRASRYALDTAGRVEDPRNASVWAPPPTGLRPRTRLMLYALGALVAVYFIADFLLAHLLQAPLPPID